MRDRFTSVDIRIVEMSARRPRSLREVVSWATTAETMDDLLREFLDEFYSENDVAVREKK